MRSSALLVAVILAPSLALAQEPAALPAAPVFTEEQPRVEEAKTPYRNYGLVVGAEGGLGTPTGTVHDVYGAGFGLGLMVGFRYSRVTLEWHFAQHYDLRAKDSHLDGDNSNGTLRANEVLARVTLIDRPLILEAMAGGAVITAPIFVATMDEFGKPIVESRGMRGIGAMVGGAVGFRATEHLAITLEVRGLISPSWELPAYEYVVPGGTLGDVTGYTTTGEDPSGTAWTATVLARYAL